MSFIFNGCSKIKEIKGLNQFNITQVIKMVGIIKGCSELTNFELSKFNCNS